MELELDSAISLNPREDCVLSWSALSRANAERRTSNAQGRSRKKFEDSTCCATPLGTPKRSCALALGPERGDDLFELRIAAQRFPEGMEFEAGIINVAGHRYQLL